jgi:hypothetical protein
MADPYPIRPIADSEFTDFRAVDEHLVTELRPGTLAPLSAAMSWDPAPWCPRIF